MITKTDCVGDISALEKTLRIMNPAAEVLRMYTRGGATLVWVQCHSCPADGVNESAFDAPCGTREGPMSNSTTPHFIDDDSKPAGRSTSVIV